MSKQIIYFRSFIQKCLWDNELSGQISDGHWENSNNSNYKFWTALDTAVDAAKPRVEAQTYGRVNFNLASSDLLSVVGGRMIAMAKMAKISKDEKIVKAAEYLEGITTLESFEKAKTTGYDYLKKELALISDDLFKQWLTSSYTEANLKTDLRDMSDIMKTAVSWSSDGADRIKTGFEEKDLQRVKDIVTKANGSEAKETASALVMAKKITDGKKALQRSAAAASLSKDNIAKAFSDRAKELGFISESTKKLVRIPASIPLSVITEAIKKHADSLDLAP
jgi:hypothetical protein